MAKNFGLLAFLFCLTLTARAEDEVEAAMKTAMDVARVYEKLINARSLQCSLGDGASAEWKQDRPTVTLDKFGSMKGYIFDSIDVRKGKARIIGGMGAGDIPVILTTSGLTFIEKTDTGNLMITTVFPFLK